MSKMEVDCSLIKSKIIFFRKGGRLPQNLAFRYGDTNLEIVNKFTYLGIVFTSVGSFSEAHATLSGQAQNVIFAMNRYLNKFVNVPPSHSNVSIYICVRFFFC